MTTRYGWCVLALMVNSACGSTSGNDDTNDDDENGAGQEARYCASLKLVCERQVECNVLLMNQATTVEGCHEECTNAAPSIFGTGAVIHEEALRRCEEQTKNATCDTLVDLGWLEAAPDCFSLLTGTAREGEPCTGGLTSGCQPGLTCDFRDQCPGTCVPEGSISEVECRGLDCPEGETCHSGECLPLAGPGESCRWPSFDQPWDRTCVEGYRCDGELDDPHCEPALEPGAECWTDNVDTCAGELTCRDGTCQERQPVGEPCSTYSECEVGLMCDFDNGTCAQPKPEGEPCNNYYFECAPGLACQDGSCQPNGDDSFASGDPVSRGPLLKPGDSCRSTGVCPLGTSCLCDGPECEQLICQPGHDLGESCAAREVTTAIDGGGSFTAVAEDPFDPYRCRRGTCDIFGTMRCVEGQPVGEPCSFDELQLTFECQTLVCANRRCQGFEALSCDASFDD